jgi:putative solute:sodium symporter small subunit
MYVGSPQRKVNMQQDQEFGRNDPDQNRTAENQRAEQYWRANLRLLGMCLAIWFVASYGFGILLVEQLNQFQLFGFKLGFWFAQQGSIYIFLLLILFYVLRINALDRRFGVHEDVVADGDE